MARRVSEKPAGGGYLDGQFLIAMPGMQDTRFSRTVIYVCAHSADGAMGIMINQLAPQITFRDLLVQLDIIPEGPEIRLPGRSGGCGCTAAARSRPAAASSSTVPTISSRIRRCRSTSRSA